ncbi:MAG: hypothetical protein K2Y51_19970 [Gammaproteobacteria bacterium]|nr:hypothetical protein [Gammaproteobacteria bacterium]
MAKLVRGKGARREVIELSRHGAVLREQRSDGDMPRLPGFRRCADAARAEASLRDEVQALVRAGMVAEDDEARALAGSAAPAPKKPTLPLRRDLGVYNEATGFVVTSRRMAGKPLAEGSAAWRKAVARGDLLPVSLVQDDSIVVRVVAGAALDAEEQDAWVARVDAHLNLADGRLCITGGAGFSQEDYDADEAYHEQFVIELPLPKGRYRATLYTLAHGINGGAVLDRLAGGHGRAEAVEAWCARTRPGETLPDAETTTFVDFLLHLEPVDAAPTTGLSRLPDDGWYGDEEQARLPARCPLGPVAQDVLRRPVGPLGEWLYVREIAPGAADQAPAPLRDGPLVCGVDALARVAQLSWFGARHGAMALCLRAPAGASLAADGEWPDGVVVVAEGDTLRVLFSADAGHDERLAGLAALAPWLGAAPAETLLEVRTQGLAVLGNAPLEAGSLWLRGRLRAGQWWIEDVGPATDKPTLDAGLALAADVLGGERLPVRDASEGEVLLDWARRKFGRHLGRPPGRLQDGAIVCDPAVGNLCYYGLAAFVRRHAAVWPSVPLEDMEDD